MDKDEKGHGKSVDIWAFGVMCFMMLTLEYPFSGPTRNDIFESIRYSDIDWSNFSFLSPNAKSFLEQVPFFNFLLII